MSVTQIRNAFRSTFFPDSCLRTWTFIGGMFPGSHFLLHPYRKPKRIRTAFNPNQLLKLEEAFEKNQYVVGAERKQLAASLNLTETQVLVLYFAYSFRAACRTTQFAQNHLVTYSWKTKTNRQTTSQEPGQRKSLCSSSLMLSILLFPKKHQRQTSKANRHHTQTVFCYCLESISASSSLLSSLLSLSCPFTLNHRHHPHHQEREEDEVKEGECKVRLVVLSLLVSRLLRKDCCCSSLEGNMLYLGLRGKQIPSLYLSSKHSLATAASQLPVNWKCLTFKTW